MVTKAQERKAEMKDEFVSVEHMMLAYLDDLRFGQALFRKEVNPKRKTLQA